MAQAGSREEAEALLAELKVRLPLTSLLQVAGLPSPPAILPPVWAPGTRAVLQSRAVGRARGSPSSSLARLG